MERCNPEVRRGSIRSIVKGDPRKTGLNQIDSNSPDQRNVIGFKLHSFDKAIMANMPIILSP